MGGPGGSGKDTLRFPNAPVLAKNNTDRTTAATATQSAVDAIAQVCWQCGDVENWLVIDVMRRIELFLAGGDGIFLSTVHWPSTPQFEENGLDSLQGGESVPVLCRQYSFC